MPPTDSRALDSAPQAGHAAVFTALIDIAREVESLKRECGTDPESPIAVQNSRYMGISYKLRALATALTSPVAPEQVVALNNAVEAARWRRLVNASELSFPVAAIADDPENDCILLYGRKRLEQFIDSLDEISNTYPDAASGEAAPSAPLLTQDENSGRDGRRYNEWHASRPDARLNAREAAAATADGCALGCAESCMAKEHGCASECPALPWQPAATPAAPSAGVLTPANALIFAENFGAWQEYTAGPIHFSADSWHRFIAALAQPAPAQAGAQQAVSDDDMDESGNPEESEALEDRLGMAFAELGLIRRRYGEPGSRDVDVSANNKAIDLARKAIYDALAKLAGSTQAGAGDAKGGA